MELTPSGLTSAEHRGLRELYAGARQLATHWGSLGRRLPDGPASAVLREGGAIAGGLLADLPSRTVPHDLHGRVAAQGVGARLAEARGGVGDRFLERNQALRLAVLDVQHVTTLLAYLGALAEARGDESQRAFCAGWEGKLAAIETRARDAAIAAGTDPDGAVEPVDPSPAGRVAHGVANAVGTAGEWVDRRIARRRSPP